jgi:hypothetical protein
MCASLWERVREMHFLASAGRAPGVCRGTARRAPTRPPARPAARSAVGDDGHVEQSLRAAGRRERGVPQMKSAPVKGSREA